MGAYYFYQRTWHKDEWMNKEVLVEEDRFVRRFLAASHPMELNVDAFHITPGYVMVDVATPLYPSADKMTLSFDYLKRGCTLLIVQLPIKTSHLFKEKYESFCRMLAGLPLDYMITPVVAPRLLTPAMVRFFGMQKVPFILFEGTDEKVYEEVAWEWLAQAQSYSRTPIAPLVSPQKENHPKVYTEWNKIVEHCDMITLQDPVTDLPLTSKNLRRAGIYPYKGELVPGGQADFNMHLHNGDTLIDDPAEISYYGSVPDITIKDGNVIQIHQQILNEKVTGMHRKVSIPMHFV
ncbi:hypothetical protein [Thalassobacillus devorans]|uniref:hypothetical protein n=1 Tax=Thalassobacillus devorans TaxID=279813 RepID=UPI00048CD5DC|nr:hypothetical protein [Thalassobacillus devorans]